MIFVALLGTIKASSLVFSYNESAQASNQVVTANCYRLFVNGIDMGLVADQEAGEQVIKKALVNLTEELGYNPEVNPTIRYYEEYSQDQAFAGEETLLVSLKEEIKAGLDVIKVKAYAVKIGDGLIMTLNSEEDVKAVLNNAKKKFISDDSMFAVNLNEVAYNTLVERPEIVLTQELLAQNKSFVTAAVDTPAAAADTSAEEETADVELDPMYHGVTVGAEFTEEIIVVETFVDGNTVMSVEDATELITKENEEPKIYEVVQGDCPSTIADSNNMSLEVLYDLNPAMENGSMLHIGDELVVMVPEPELSVSTTEEVVYSIPIERETTYVENPDKYVGSSKTVEAGSDGEKQITALLTKLNGKELSREITLETVLVEPVAKVVEKGTKALPPKGATGAYILPVSSYVLSSGFGYRWGGFHYGVDLAAPTGTTIMAADGGTVVYAGWKDSYGYLIEIDHGGGITTRYAHCSSIGVSVGQQVAQYQEIGKVGSTGRSTGPHCHFEIRIDGTAVNPLKYAN